MNNPSPNPPAHHWQTALSFERIVFFSDAVFAIAITLLVIEIKVPVIGHHEGAIFPTIDELREQGPFELAKLIPKFVGYIMSFLVISQYWINHHRNFGHFNKYDSGLIWRNLLLLMSIAFIPFTTGLYSEYYYWNSALMIYSANIFLAGVLQWVIWRYATKNYRLVEPSLNHHLIDKITLAHIGTPATFLLAFVVTWLFNVPYVLGFVWILIPISTRIANQRYERRIANETIAVEEPS